MKKKKGQSVVEYSFLLVLIVGIFSAVSIYVRRSLQARIWDARNGMIYSIAATYNASAFSPKTTIEYEYEPYYAQSSTNGISDYHGSESLSAGGTTGVVLRTFLGASGVNSLGAQLPPKDAK